MRLCLCVSQGPVQSTLTTSIVIFSLLKLVQCTRHPLRCLTSLKGTEQISGFSQYHRPPSIHYSASSSFSVTSFILSASSQRPNAPLPPLCSSTSLSFLSRISWQHLTEISFAPLPPPLLPHFFLYVHWSYFFNVNFGMVVEWWAWSPPGSDLGPVCAPASSCIKTCMLS